MHQDVVLQGVVATKKQFIESQEEDISMCSSHKARNDSQGKSFYKLHSNKKGPPRKPAP